MGDKCSAPEMCVGSLSWSALTSCDEHHCLICPLMYFEAFV